MVEALIARGADVARRRQGRRHQRAEPRGQRREPRAKRARRRDSEASCRRKRRDRAAGALAARVRRGATNGDSGGEPEPLGYADLVGAHGGLTALLLAAREGLDETVFALVDGGADINQVSAVGSHQPAADGGDQRPFRSGRCGCWRAAPT